MDTGAIGGAVEAADDEGGVGGACDGVDFEIGDGIVGEEGFEGLHGEVFVEDEVLVVRGGEFGDVGAGFAGAGGAEFAVVLDEGEFWLDAGEGGAAGEECDLFGIFHIHAGLVEGRGDGVVNRDCTGAVLAEGEEQFETGGLAFSEEAGLGFLEPAFGHEVVEEGVQALLGDVRWFLEGERPGDWGVLGGEVGGVVGEGAALAGLLAQDAGVGALVVDLSPQQFGHLDLGFIIFYHIRIHRLKVQYI